MYCVLISVGHIHIVLTARTATTMRGGVAQQCYGNASNYAQDRQTDSRPTRSWERGVCCSTGCGPFVCVPQTLLVSWRQAGQAKGNHNEKQQAHKTQMIIVSNHDVVQHSPPQLPLHVSLPIVVVIVAVANTDNVVDDSSSKTVICHSLRHSHNHNRSQTRSQRHEPLQSPF